MKKEEESDSRSLGCYFLDIFRDTRARASRYRVQSESPVCTLGEISLFRDYMHRCFLFFLYLLENYLERVEFTAVTFLQYENLALVINL